MVEQYRSDSKSVANVIAEYIGHRETVRYLRTQPVFSIDLSLPENLKSMLARLDEVEQLLAISKGKISK